MKRNYKTIATRVTIEEYKLIEEKAKKAHVRVAVYVRIAALNIKEITL